MDAKTQNAIWDIETLQGTIGVIPYETMEREALKRAIKALEKQIPKKPFINDYSLTCCPNCHGIEVLAGCESIQLNYCNQCGQKLDWE